MRDRAALAGGNRPGILRTRSRCAIHVGTLVERLKRKVLSRRTARAWHARILTRFPEYVWFDAAFYLARHADAAAAVRSGKDATALDHFLRVGLAEGRTAIADFDEHYYLATYPAVAAAIARGEFASAYQHYLLFGLAGRLNRHGNGEEPRPASAPATERWGRDELSAFERTRDVVIEFTTRCNLRCVYCAVSQPNYRGADLDTSDLDGLIEGLRRRGAEVVTVSGHGETTILEGWQSSCRKLIDAGFRLHIITNFGRAIGDDEAETLARFHSIDVSVDSDDPETFRRLRRGGDLRTVLYDMAKVRAAARYLRLPGPLWKWNSVVNDVSIGGLDRVVRFGLSEGVTSFYFKNLVEYEEPPHGDPVRHVARLTPDEMKAARQMLLDCRRLADEGGAECDIEAGLLDALDLALAGNAHVRDTEIADIPAARFAAETTRVETRDCLDPWDFVYVDASRSVRPCCMMDRSYGSIAGGASIDDVVENDAFRQLRQELLTGNLNEVCAGCPCRSRIPVEAFREKVRKKAEERSL